MSLSFPGPIVITGSNGGLGSAVAEGFLKAGFNRIACQYRSRAETITDILTNHGLSAGEHLFQAELTREEEVRRMESAVKEHLGTPWGVVNLAGGSTNGLSWKLSLADFQIVLGMNLTTSFLMTRVFLPDMLREGGGRIINISSIVAHSGVVGASHYCAAKAGIEGFTKSVALECANKHVTVNAIALGYFDAGIISQVPMEMLESIKKEIPLKRLGKAAEIFPLVAYLLGSESDLMTGQIIHLNGGHYL